MATVPQDLLDLLNEAQKQLDEAQAAAVFHEVKVQELQDALDDEDEAKEDAFEQLQESNAAAAVALDSLKKHFGI